MAFTQQQELAIRKFVLQNTQENGLSPYTVIQALLSVWFKTKSQQNAQLQTLLQGYRDREQQELDAMDSTRATEAAKRAARIAELDGLLTTLGIP
jgi:hypothetical protein